MLPLHTRALCVELRAAAGGGLHARASLIDMRKTGVVPVGGDLGTPGVVHHMWIDADIDRDGRRLTHVAAQQPQVAFEPSPVTGGESCRDATARLSMLEGLALDGGADRALSAAQGGPRGCSHLLTISQVLVAAVSWAFAHGGVAPSGAGFQAGERVFRRDIVTDGSREGDGLMLTAQLTDLTFAAAAEIAQPMQRFTAVHEVRLRAPIDMSSMSFGAIEASERRRDGRSLADVAWQDRAPRLAGLRGVTVFRGVSATLMAQLGGAAADRPLLDAALMLAPTFIQVCGAMSDSWLAAAAAADSVIGMSGMPDSCYMWRRGGPLDRLRGPGDPVPTL